MTSTDQREWLDNAIAELEREERLYHARRTLMGFVNFTKPDYIAGSHLAQLADLLERIERGECRRAAVFMPPRHGKSELCSVRFPCWYLARNPTRQVVQSGYSAEIALTHSRNARDVFVSPEFQELFPQAQPVPTRHAATEWGTVAGGRYYAVGVGGGLTGRGADLAIIDDPVKDRAEANSSTVRSRVLDWYRSTLRTRLSPTGAILLVMTRWSPNDLAGHLLAEMGDGGEAFEVLQMPALDDDGNALWPERFDRTELDAIRSSIGKYEWSALYMQQPVVRGGNRFAVDEIVYHDSLDDFPQGRYVRAWDLASSAKQRSGDDPDYTVGVLGTAKRQHGGDEFWIKDLRYFREEAPKRDAMILATTEQDGPTVAIGVEGFGAYKDAHATLQNTLRGKRTVQRLNPSGDKEVKASVMEAPMEARRFHVLRAPWNDFLVRQLSEFPDGSHDDAVDACALIWHMTAKPQSGIMRIR